MFSKRHIKVKKLVNLTLFLGLIFGVNSFFYLLSENKLKEKILVIEAKDALYKTTTFDQISFLNSIKKNSTYCKNNFPTQCVDYFTTIIRIRNRMNDYKIALNETIYLAKESPIYDHLDKVRSFTDEIANKIFKLSFKDAKEKGVRNSYQYIQLVNIKSFDKKYFAKLNNEVINKLDENYKKISDFLIKYDSRSLDFNEIYKNINSFYTILVLIEIVIFLLVAYIDISNNNVAKSQDSED